MKHESIEIQPQIRHQIYEIRYLFIKCKDNLMKNSNISKFNATNKSENIKNFDSHLILYVKSNSKWTKNLKL